EDLALCERFRRLDPDDAEWARETFQAQLHRSNLPGPDPVGSVRSQLGFLRDFLDRAAAQKARSPGYLKWAQIEAPTQPLIAMDLFRPARLGEDPAANLAAAREAHDRARALTERIEADPTHFGLASNRSVLERFEAELRAAEGDAAGYLEASLRAN